jgi:hypothetical protein
MTDMLFGSREAWIANPFGKLWTVPALKGELTQEEMQQRMKAKGYQQNVAIVAPTAASFWGLLTCRGRGTTASNQARSAKQHFAYRIRSSQAEISLLIPCSAFHSEAPRLLVIRVSS